MALENRVGICLLKEEIGVLVTKRAKWERAILGAWEAGGGG